LASATVLVTILPLLDGVRPGSLIRLLITRALFLLASGFDIRIQLSAATELAMFLTPTTIFAHILQCDSSPYL
jgi:hypothetical protein